MAYRKERLLLLTGGNGALGLSVYDKWWALGLVRDDPNRDAALGLSQSAVILLAIMIALPVFQLPSVPSLLSFPGRL